MILIFVSLCFARAASLEIECGHSHNCVFERGTMAMKCWGRNDKHQLGLNDTNNRGDDASDMGSNLPLVNLGSEFMVEKMTLSQLHTCAVSYETAKCFGLNSEGQLGFNGSTTTGDSLPSIDFGANTNLSKVAAGIVHTCALSTDAVLKCFGDNWYGQCGAGTSTNPISSPTSQISAIELGTNFTAVDVRTFYYHVCVLSQQRTIKCFGDNREGQLGYGDTTKRGSTPESMGDGLPIVDLGSDFVPKMIATGGSHTCALSTSKAVKCWGLNKHGQCGTPHSKETGDSLPILDLGADFVAMQLALGGHHTCILSENVTIKCFGYNAYGQLGIGSTTDVDAPSTLAPIDLGSGFVVRQIAAGWSHTCAVSTNNNDIKCWGYNEYGELGLGHTNDVGDEPEEMGDNLPFVAIGYLTKAPSSQPTMSPNLALQTNQPNQSFTTTYNNSVTVTIRTDSLSSTQILIAVANVYNFSSTVLTVTTLSSSDDDDGLATVELLVAVATNVQLDYDVIEATLREAMVEEYGDDVEVDIAVGPEDETPAPGTTSLFSLHWMVVVALCIASVCFCGAVVAVLKWLMTKTTGRQPDGRDHRQNTEMQQIEIPAVSRALAVPSEERLDSKSDAYPENKEDVIEPGAGGQDLVSGEDSASNRAEELQASVTAQTAASTAGLAADEFEVLDEHETKTGSGQDLLDEDEFEVIDDNDDEVTAGQTHE